tara:strand:- start:508 stop:1128 length:621 start_codon:yes stop_codon:yes gene_type:complete
MIKLAVSLIFLSLISACSGISYQQVYPLIKAATIGSPDLIITQEYSDSQEFSFIKARFGKGPGVIMVLVAVDDSNIYQWVSADDEILYTLNGKVIKSSGLPYNISYLRNIGPGFYSYAGFDTTLQLKNPSAYVTNNLISISEEVETLNLLSPTKVKKYIVKSTINELNWSRKNIYYVDLSTNNVLKTTQYLHPNLPKLDIEFYLKF